MSCPEPASLVIFTCRGPRHYALINSLARSYRIKGIVFENQFRLRVRLLMRRLQNLGLLEVANQLMFKVLDVLFFQREEAIKAVQMLGEDAVFDRAKLGGAAIVDTASINSSAAIALVEREQPDVVVVSGTSILRPLILHRLGTTPVINIHCGITPRYRGAHGAFWAVVNGDWQNVGTTVHFIDAGIDTGGIIGQGSIRLEPHDNPRTLALKQYCSGIPLVSKAIESVRCGNTATVERTDLDSRVYSSPTFTSYLAFKRQLRRHFPS